MRIGIGRIIFPFVVRRIPKGAAIRIIHVGIAIPIIVNTVLTGPCIGNGIMINYATLIFDNRVSFPVPLLGRGVAS